MSARSTAPSRPAVAELATRSPAHPRVYAAARPRSGARADRDGARVAVIWPCIGRKWTGLERNFPSHPKCASASAGDPGTTVTAVAPDDPLGDASARVAGAVTEDRPRTAPTGLTAAEVAERTARGERNDVSDRTSRTITEIVRANVLTRF